MKASIALVLALSGAPALAERWGFVPNDLAGEAEVATPAGNRLAVTCGELGLRLTPPPPLPQAAEAGSVALRFVIDGNPQDAFDVPMTCRRLTSCDTGLDAFTLDGSSAAIDGMRRGGCPGL
jgi:hypothetical protein